MSLEQENRKLQRSINTLLSRIEQNQRIQQRFYDFEFQLLACTSLADFFEKLLRNCADHFNLDSLSLVIYDPDYSIRDLMENLDIHFYDNRLQLRHNAEFFTSIYGSPPQVAMGPLDLLTAARLFPNTETIGSAALLPLIRQSQLIGSLHWGSTDTARFTEEKATDFIVHLALVVGVCLENCISHEQLHRQGLMDMLTRVHNRRSFEDEYAKELGRAERTDEALSCMFVDVDYFKKVNDTHGHQMGDLCLKQVAQQIQKQLRKTDLLARYGGEEFVVLLPRCSPDQALVTAERIRESISSLLISTDKDVAVNITASLGVATWKPKFEATLDVSVVGERLLKAADQAMYDAKNAGRNQVCVREFEV